MSTVKVAALALVMGGGIGFGVSQWWPMLSHGHDSSVSVAADEPLYWVAPMDPNYRRDKPGKSPMGMDLIPVYAEDAQGDNVSAGTVTINPAVENNLGVKTELAQMSVLTPHIDTVGYIAFDESQLWQTNVRVAGWVEQLNINAVGEHVRKGEVLFTLYSPELIKAQEELLRAYQSQRNAMITGAKERLMTLGVDEAQIKALLRRGKATQTIDIKAPADGVIASLNIREGGYLSPAQAAVSAGPLSEVWVDAEVLERQAHWIRQGSQATMRLDAIPTGQWQGEVEYIYPILDPKTRTLRVRLKFDNPQGQLKPNMFANVTLTPVSDDAVLIIPKSAVIRSGGMTRIVLSLGEGRYRSARIDVGREAGDKVEVLKGLKAGDRVVTSAHFMLDSESSQSADLSRINGVEAPAERVWATGSITEVMADHRMLTLNHQPVPEWNWPGMVMNFTLDAGLDMQGLSVGQTIEFEMEKGQNGQYQIVDYSVSDQVAPSQVWVTGEITMLMADFGMVTLSHQAVSEWNWPAGEMNFSVDDTIALGAFREGQTVRFLIEKQGADYQLTRLDAQEGEL
ncbi:efflux RND transporter periplasmic adaptor subunit [Vibrio scophthalmi]|uniref:efflux RND transporter periplasmic adaptor subunit n=1 Tax=Vibrio scophthalmi TaxID=45658 RepID=UPI002FEFEF6F